MKFFFENTGANHSLKITLGEKRVINCMHDMSPVNRIFSDL